LALAVASAACVAGTAGAASQSVKGTGDIQKMVVDNAKKALKVKLLGFDAPCDAHYMKITVDWGKKSGYAIDQGCYPGAEWGRSLVYMPDRGTPETGKIVACAKLRFAYVKKDGSYRMTVPRSCIPKAGERLRVSAFGDNYGSPTGGEAGPTKRLKRG
jgi:hypothetical protein